MKFKIDKEKQEQKFKESQEMLKEPSTVSSQVENNVPLKVKPIESSASKKKVENISSNKEKELIEKSEKTTLKTDNHNADAE